jgi:hypothetical protein
VAGAGWEAGKEKGKLAPLPPRRTWQVDALSEKVTPNQHIRGSRPQPVDRLEPLRLLDLAVNEGALDAARSEEGRELLGSAAREHSHEHTLGAAAALFDCGEKVVFIPPQPRGVNHFHLAGRSRE